jgi:alkaline phosphatase D
MSGSKNRRRKSGRRGVTRRDFLKRASAASVVLSAPLLNGCDNDGIYGGDGGDGGNGGGAEVLGFRHGVASGDPLSDRVILWTHVTPATEGAVHGTWSVATDPAMSQKVSEGAFSTDHTRAFTVNVDAAGLQPATTYYYQFEAGGVKSLIGRTRTLPVGDVDRLRIAVVSCASLAHGLFNAYRRVAERADLDLVVHLGDYIYDYGSGEYGNARPYEPPGETITLSDYRQRYAQYRRDADLMELHRQHPIVAIWDDHETADNSWRDGAVNHNEGEGDWNARVGVALQAFYEWMPTRRVDPSQPRKNYRSYRIGNLAELVMLEERLLAREEQIPGLVTVSGTELGLVPIGEVESGDRQLIGPEQEAWLATTLRATPAKWKLIGQGVMFGHLKLAGIPDLGIPDGVYINPDQWDGYPQARSRVFDILTGTGGSTPIDNVVVLTGDIHTSWSMDVSRDPNNPLVYNPLTGTGSIAVEFVATSITSPGLDTFTPFLPLVTLLNPHMKYIDFTRKGYLLLDVTPERVVGEHWFVDTIDTASSVETLGNAMQVDDGENRLVDSTQTTPRANPPPPAP